jgi:hypothetical protein
MRKALIVLLTILGVLAIVGAVASLLAEPHGIFDPTFLLLALPVAAALLGMAAILRYIPDMRWTWMGRAFVGGIVWSVGEAIHRGDDKYLLGLLFVPLLGLPLDYLAWRRARARRLRASQPGS